MTLIAREPQGSSIPALEPGVYMAKCFMVADIGEQMQDFEGKEVWKPQVIIGWEIEGESVEVDGESRPRTFYKWYTMSLHKRSKLRPDLETWRGKPFTEEELAGFDLRNIIGAGCQLQLETATKQDGSTYSRIKAIMALPRGVQVTPPSQRIAFDLDAEGAKEQIEFLPPIVQAAIGKSRQMNPEGKATPPPIIEEKPFGDEGSQFGGQVYGDINELNQLFSE